MQPQCQNLTRTALHSISIVPYYGLLDALTALAACLLDSSRVDMAVRHLKPPEGGVLGRPAPVPGDC